jgi:membrane protein YqaA with SNARE-associated domain
LLLLWLVAHGGSRYLLAACAIAGSLIGGYVAWSIGRKGGEIALRKYISARMLSRVQKWVERHPLLSVFVPTMLPPPIPLSPFLLASGALGVPRTRFLAVFGAARILRYGLVAWFAASYGRKAVRLWSTGLQKWSMPLLCTFFTAFALSIGYGIWRLRQRPQSAQEALAVGHD